MSTPPGFDLTATEAVKQAEDAGVTIEIQDLNSDVMLHDDDVPVTVTVAGSYSSHYRKAQQAQTNRALKQRRTKFDAQMIERNRAEVAAACVLEWDGFYDDGEPLDCTRSNVLKVFEAAPWILQQVEAAIEDHAGFMRNNSPS